MTSETTKFDFEKHRADGVSEYEKLRPLYTAYCLKLKEILAEALARAKIGTASIEARAKEVESFADKVVTPSEADPERPKYPTPLKDITDLAAARVITFFPKSVSDAERVVRSEFEVVERLDKSQTLLKEERFGYQSIHFLVKLSRARANLPEYSRFTDLVAEIQVRTILQHAWAEIEHDIQYKAIEVLPAAVVRRFAALAGLLEIADREFQAIQDEDAHLRQVARQSVKEGRLDEVEITADALKAYLDDKLGPDGRMKDYAYGSQAVTLRAYGFTNFRQIDELLARYDDDRLSRIVWGNRQGQLTRFETILLAALGQAFIDRHPALAGLPWWRDWKASHLRKLQDAGVPIGDTTLRQPVGKAES